ncbi:hypothetical protein [Halorubrum lipolyticum]|uniref:hypothetical protein n=1 Tax=Halorubrum lipolyticum TaxID=368624 RepID=UPI0011C8F60C|nr:hypothetical protein [Halorubrum lipolyticum]
MGEHDVEDSKEGVQTEIRTDVEYEGEGTVYAVKTAQQGKRRVDFKIGHIDGTYAEGLEYYYDGESFNSTGMYKVPENAPSGRYKDDKFYELIDGDISLTEDSIIESKEHDRQGVDTTEWAKERLEWKPTASEVLNDDWVNSAQDHFEDEFE